MVLQEFAFKSGAKKVLKLCTTINRRKKEKEEMKFGDSSIEMGFVDKFVKIFRLRNKLNKLSAEISEKKCSQNWSFMWGYELYNKTALYANPLFENMSIPVMKEETQKDRIRGSLFMVKSLKAQINALMISMNHEYLTLMNITLFAEVIYKFLDSTSSQ